MPPASLPAIPAMSPGPMTARNATQTAPAAEPPAQAQHVAGGEPLADATRSARERTGRLAPRARLAPRRRRLAGRIVSMASSTVTIPTSRRSSSTTGTASRL